jgi:hypothetical protein
MMSGSPTCGIDAAESGNDCDGFHQLNLGGVGGD